MGTHGRPVMGSHRPGPMGPRIVPSPPPGWPDVARSQPFLSNTSWLERRGGPNLTQTCIHPSEEPPSSLALHVECCAGSTGNPFGARPFSRWGSDRRASWNLPLGRQRRLGMRAAALAQADRSWPAASIRKRVSERAADRHRLPRRSTRGPRQPAGRGMDVGASAAPFLECCRAHVLPGPRGDGARARARRRASCAARDRQGVPARCARRVSLEQRGGRCYP